MSKQAKKQPQPRNPVALVARMRNSSGVMRDRRSRRAKDARKSWTHEQW